MAPPISAQVSPVASQRSHWYSKVTGAVPDQTPGSAVTVCPSRSVSGNEKLGSRVFCGAAASTEATGEVAVTYRRRSWR